MKRAVAIMMITMFCGAACSRVGSVSLGVAFNFHPLVMLYYYPSQKAFLRPVEGPLTVESIAAAERASRRRAGQANAEARRKAEDIQDEILKLQKELEQVESRRDNLKNRLFEKQRKLSAGKDPEQIRKLNVSFQEEYSRTMDPVNARLENLKREISGKKAEKERLFIEEQYAVYTEPEETKQLIDQVEKEILAAVEKVAQRLRLGLVLNSTVWESRGETGVNAPDSYVSPDYDRVRELAGFELNEEIQNPSPGIASVYLQVLQTRQALPLSSDLLKRAVAGQTSDITIDVVEELLSGSGINSGVKRAIIRYLKEKGKKGGE